MFVLYLGRQNLYLLFLQTKMHDLTFLKLQNFITLKTLKTVTKLHCQYMSHTCPHSKVLIIMILGGGGDGGVVRYLHSFVKTTVCRVSYYKSMNDVKWDADRWNEFQVTTPTPCGSVVSRLLLVRVRETLFFPGQWEYCLYLIKNCM